jgi:hypothetical protein
MVSRVSDHHSKAEKCRELIRNTSDAEHWNLYSEEEFRPFESIGRWSPERGTCGYAPGEQACREDAGYFREKLMLPSGLVDR